jgi:hypothetical protein
MGRIELHPQGVRAVDLNQNEGRVSAPTGVNRCTSNGCHGHLGASGQEVTRLICDQCGQNYQVVIYLKPVPPKKGPILLENLVKSA